MYKIILECCIDDPATMNEEIKNFAEKYNCEYVILQEADKYTGWPEVMFTADKLRNLMELLYDYAGENFDEFMDFFDMIDFGEER